MPSMPNNALHRTLDSAGDGVRRAAGPINLSTENWPHAYDPVPSRWLVPNGFTSHRGEDVLRAFSFGSELGSRPWTKSVADDHCHQHVDRGFKGRLLGGRRIAHIAPAVRGPRCCGGAGALAFPLGCPKAHEWARTDSRPSATVSSRSSLRSWCWS